VDSTGTTRLLAVGSVTSAATAIRIGRTYAKAVSKQTPKLLDLWLEACEPEAKPDAAKRFRSGVIRAARENTKSALDHVEGGLDDLEWFTTPRKEKRGKARPGARAKARRSSRTRQS
jgi:hypothetical protein